MRYVISGQLTTYPQLPAVGGDLLARLGRNQYQEARAEFERAAELTRNARERAVFLGRAASLWTARTCVFPDVAFLDFLDRA